MSPLPPHVDEEYIYRDAPSGKVARSARELALSNSWVQPTISPEGDWLMARCDGSYDRYELWVDLIEPGGPKGDCDCPSFKQPCKHVLGLAYLALLAPDRLTEGPIPNRVKRAREQTYGSRPTVPPRPKKAAKKGPKDLGESLLRDISEHPTDDAPRLVYADWLQEHGGPEESARSEFIQVQCRLAQLSPEATEWTELRGREAELWKTYRSAWLSELPEKLPSKAVVFHRGFLEELPIKMGNLRRFGEQVFKSYPTITRVRFTDALRIGGVSQLVMLPFLNQLTGLEFDKKPIDVGKQFFELLFSGPYLSNITTLRFPHLGLGSRNVALIVENPFTAHLEVLDLQGNQIGEAGVKALLNSPHLNAIKTLHLEDNNLSRAYTAALRERFGQALHC